MFKAVNVAVAAYRAAVWGRASRPLPHLSDRLLRDIGFMRARVADNDRTRSTVIPFGPFGLPIGF